jgi:siderophore synthetase component
MDENYRPKALVLKDFIDDVNLSEHNLKSLNSMPLQLQNTLYRLSNEDMAQFIQTGLFVVLYRYLSDILLTYAGYSETQFWQQLHTEIEKYHQSHPELSEQIQGINLLKPQFKKLNLNRLRLIEVGYADYNQRPKVESRVMMDNPVSYEIWSKDAPLKTSNGAKVNV